MCLCVFVWCPHVWGSSASVAALVTVRAVVVAAQRMRARTAWHACVLYLEGWLQKTPAAAAVDLHVFSVVHGALIACVTRDPLGQSVGGVCGATTHTPFLVASWHDNKLSLLVAAPLPCVELLLACAPNC